MTKEEILAIAAKRDFVVHRYKESHTMMRKLVHQLVNEGLLVMTLYDGNQFYYRAKGTEKVREALKRGDKDFNRRCKCCGQTPTVHPTGLCGPCCFGEASTIGGNW